MITTVAPQLLVVHRKVAVAFWLSCEKRQPSAAFRMA